jgi:dipeptidyl aminopeptidase/acylaminoacyl peptidase
METVDTGFTSHLFPKFSPSGDKIYCVGGSTTRSYCVIEVDVQSKQVVIIKKSNCCEVDPGYISEPKVVTFPTEDNKVAHGFLYLPKVGQMCELLFE